MVTMFLHNAITIHPHNNELSSVRCSITSAPVTTPVTRSHLPSSASSSSSRNSASNRGRLCFQVSMTFIKQIYSKAASTRPVATT
jgi:hypothetical protein